MGISTGDFAEAFTALVGKEAPGLSGSTIARIKEVWSEEHARWQKRDLLLDLERRGLTL
jgi:putative transposase